jgi:hypothetical protein
VARPNRYPLLSGRRFHRNAALMPRFDGNAGIFAAPDGARAAKIRRFPLI